MYGEVLRLTIDVADGDARGREALRFADAHRVHRADALLRVEDERFARGGGGAGGGAQALADAPGGAVFADGGLHRAGIDAAFFTFHAFGQLFEEAFAQFFHAVGEDPVIPGVEHGHVVAGDGDDVHAACAAQARERGKAPARPQRLRVQQGCAARGAVGVEILHRTALVVRPQRRVDLRRRRFAHEYVFVHLAIAQLFGPKRAQDRGDVRHGSSSFSLAIVLTPMVPSACR